MLKDHPRGLFVLFFANMGERFGYYTMMAILMFFVGARFGLTKEDLGYIWGAFLFAIYFLPLFGGILADRIGYGKTVVTGIVVMILGYCLMAIPVNSLTFVLFALFVISAGTGLFKGNMAVLLGNLYEGEKFKKIHDAAFNIYYMGINIGAFFSPYAATAIRNFLLSTDGFTYEKEIPGMAHQFLKNTLEASKLPELTELARAQLGGTVVNLQEFCTAYTDSLSQAYNASFGLAAVSILLSLAIFIGFKKHYKSADYLKSKKIAAANEDEVELTPKQTRDRIVALMLVFLVVIFFWMAFHQNGFILALFAKNYTAASVGPFTKIFFDLPAFLSVIFAVIGLVWIAGKRFQGMFKVTGAVFLIAGTMITFFRYRSFGPENSIDPEHFQAFNPIFVVFLTPVILAFFAILSKRGKEPSSPRKICIGMAITAVAYIVMVLASRGLASPAELETSGSVSSVLCSPYWLITTYFSLTIAELFLSPMGLAFVAKVAPPKIRGMMQGGWLAATAIGNLLCGAVMGIPYGKLPLWMTFAIMVFTSLLSFAFILFILKKLEAATES